MKTIPRLSLSFAFTAIFLSGLPSIRADEPPRPNIIVINIDGVDIWPVLVGDPETPPRDGFLYFKDLNLEAVREGPWKLHLSLADGAPGEKRSQPRPQLFHLGDDIGETRNLSADHPEVVARLQSIAEKADADLGVEGVGPGCREVGRVENPQPFIAHDGTVRPDAVGETPAFP